MTRTAAPDWAPLDAELARWREAGLVLPLWWRDDDATGPTPALDRLAELSRSVGLPVHLAVIPRGATTALAQRIAASRGALIPMVHGWAHENHAPEGEKKAEFGAHRPAAEALADAQKGLKQARALFGPALRPVFVPPWNRIAPGVVAGLPGLGFCCISTFKPRAAPQAAPGLEQVNTHIDPIAWRAGRGLADPDALIAQTAGQLADRREGRADMDEPFGLLTHHLVHDDAIWDFTGAFLRRMTAGPVIAWTAPPEQTEDTDEPT